MEEISSLDSFHTDGADSIARPDSEPSKQDEFAAPSDTTPTNEQSDLDVSATKESSTADTTDDGANNEEEFEEISDGTFEVDDNSRATSAGRIEDEQPKDKPAVEKTVGGEDAETQVTKSKEQKPESVRTPEEGQVDASESADFEEVDANLSTNASGTAPGDESDMLGESDMTLPNDEVDADADAPVPELDKSVNSTGMEVDNADNEAAGTSGGDVEMISVSNPSAVSKDANKFVDNDDDEAQLDYSMEIGDETEEVGEADEGGEAEEVGEAEEAGEADETEEIVETEETGEIEETGETEEIVETEETGETEDNVDMDETGETEESGETEQPEGDADVHSTSSKDVVDTVEKDNDDDAIEDQPEELNKSVSVNADDSLVTVDAAEDEEPEQDDEPVENVQEPEESDVCLIPDDTETQMTDAEKEQAILAREKVEKEDEEAEAEKEKEKEAEAAKESQAEVDKEEMTVADTENADAEAQAKQAGAEAEVAATSSKESTPPPVVGTSDNAEAPEVQEEIQNSTGEAGTTTKIIINWIVATEKTCKQCGEERSCGFRFKNPESSEYEFICAQSCCETIIASNPGKYFIRRKKFLVEELSAIRAGKDEEGKDKSDVEASTDKSLEAASAKAQSKNGGPAAGSTSMHNCMQCNVHKFCKYFFKQDDELFYVCNDDCFDLISSTEPEKFKLKRHSIRVRNIGATTISVVDAVTPSVKKGASSGRSAESRVVARTTAEAEAARLERVASFTRRCAECSAEVTLGDKNLLWETMDFCNELCLGKYQRNIGASCQTCRGDVPHQALGKYCVRFGFDIRQFCCASCLNEYKKGLKTCSCCQKDISSGHEGFLAPVGDKEQFKDFCSQACMRRYDSMCNPKKKQRNDICAVCNNDKQVRVEILIDDKEHNFCSNPCFSAFKFVSNIVADQCGMCCKYFERKGAESFTIYTERRAKVFCSRICLNVYIIVNRCIVSCQWCKVKKYNFDMIYKQHDGRETLMCSLNCLTLYGVSINAFSRTVAKCDSCNNTATPQYHLTMSDASMRNFCTYQCVMQFQSQFARTPLTLESETSPSHQPQATTTTVASKTSVPFPTGLPKRVKLKMNQEQQPTKLQKLPNKTIPVSKKGPTVPVISTVSSLASGETETMIGSVTVRRSRCRGRKMEATPPSPLPAQQTNNLGTGRGRIRRQVAEYTRSPSPVSISPPRSTSSKRGTAVSTPSAPAEKVVPVATETKIIAVPPYPPAVRNIQTSCKPQLQSIGLQCEPEKVSIGIQTDKDYSNKVLIPVPVPIYIPQPMYMYSAPFPVPVPIPLPIPVPIFIPTTRNSSQGILKEIKKIQDKMPADPFEAELLMMAEMVAEEKHESDSGSDDEIKPDPGAVTTLEYGNNVQQHQQHQVEVANNSYGEDVLQMALKMATGEYEQPSVDLESAMTANTITNPPPGMVVHDDSMTHMGGHQMQQEHHIMDVQQRSSRGRKRGALSSPVSPRNSRSPLKRQRTLELEGSEHVPSSLVQGGMQSNEKPDANMCLKFTFGVNAWKQWVMTKNADIEKSSVRRRTFKTELLQMTADELDFSLCLFVKEVRKPNGSEYAPDTIYYLVLGIQQYLYENGRIDSIFTDTFYERFTDTLDEVARKFSVLYNDSQYIVTRVEEEHLWECKQLGAHSPHVLLSTLMFFNTKHFNLTTVEEHMQLSFSHIMKHWKRSAQNAKSPGTRNVLLRFYPPQAGLDANPRKKKVYEQQENEENPLRCPVRLYEFYLSKCPESVKTRNDVFYLQPERSCVPDSPVWYSTQALSRDALEKMLHRVKMVKEINIALLTS